jgi:uncharacterized protein (TIGR02246 family)
MRKGIFFLTVLALALSTGLAQAGDKEDIMAARDGAIAAWNAGDVEAIQKYYAPELTRFSEDGNLLSGAWPWAALKQQFFESGGKVLISPPRHAEVKVYGNTAIMTSYSELTVTEPDGTSETTTRRNTLVWVKQSGKWKVVHLHSSPLMPQE